MKRIIYNKENGKPVNIIVATDMQLDHIDLEDTETLLQDVSEFHIDLITKSVIIDKYSVSQPTYEELQQQLLQAEGII
jgi:hypothetical protein